MCASVAAATGMFHSEPAHTKSTKYAHARACEVLGQHEAPASSFAQVLPRARGSMPHEAHHVRVDRDAPHALHTLQ